MRIRAISPAVSAMSTEMRIGSPPPSGDEACPAAHRKEGDDAPDRDKPQSVVIEIGVGHSVAVHVPVKTDAEKHEKRLYQHDGGGGDRYGGEDLT